MGLQHRFVLWSGFLGATASCLAKLALSADEDSPLYLFRQQCAKRLTEDLDVILMRQGNFIVGELMVKYRIVLMHKWKYLQQVIQNVALDLHIFEVEWCQTLSWIPRVLCLLLVVTLNVFMVASFLRGIRESGSVAGTALSSASNFACSAMYGYLFYNETFTQTWWMGFASVVSGVLILSTVQSTSPDDLVDTATKRTNQPKLRQYGAPTKKRSTGLFLSIPKRSTALVERSFANECPLCKGQLFDESSGKSPMAIADLSPNCFHVVHGKCLKQQTPTSNASATRRSSIQAGGCPVCDKSISMWVSAKQAAHFAGFWIDRVETCLQQLGPDVVGHPSKNNPATIPRQPVPASAVRDRLALDESLSEEQKRYIHEDPTGLGKGLAAALEWGGYVDFNGCNKGQVGWSQHLRSRGLWKYDVRHDDLWLWEWGNAHPRQRCDGCQFLKRPLSYDCKGCRGSSECAYYCSESCQKRDWQRHKMSCENWKQYGPAWKGN
jgi:multidrug transporter EmrE-like cation transporter